MRKFIIRATCNMVAYGIGICAFIVLILFTRLLLEKTNNVAGNNIARVITVFIYTVTLTALCFAFHAIVRRLFSKKEKNNDRDEIVAD